MSTSRFQVVVVGGGPAGSAAARTLAAAGIKVCLIDRSVFPRDKLCGGLLTLRSKKAFEMIFQSDWLPAIHARSQGARFYYQDRLLNSVTDYKDLYFTCRREYDALLVNLAHQSGATLVQGQPVQTLDLPHSSLRLSNGAIYEYDYLIGADGVNSLVAKTIFGKSFQANRIGFGLEMEVPLTTEIPPIDAPEIYFGLVDWGYGWVFPKRHTLTVGVGGLFKKNPHLRETLTGFLTQRFGQLPSAKIQGHYIPFGDFRKTPGRNNVLLCGDAAGLVEPITGEGIAFAMLSGFYAAEGIKEAVAQATPGAALTLYLNRYATLVNTFQQARLLRHFLFPKRWQSLFAKVLPRSHSLPRRQLDVMADDLSYREFIRFLVKKTCGSAVKKLAPW